MRVVTPARGWHVRGLAPRCLDGHRATESAYVAAKQFLDDGLMKHGSCLVTAQIQEMEMVRQKFYQLEQTQIAIKQKYVSSCHAIRGVAL